jgi:hypothetical protein
VGLVGVPAGEITVDPVCVKPPRVMTPCGEIDALPGPCGGNTGVTHAVAIANRGSMAIANNNVAIIPRVSLVLKSFTKISLLNFILLVRLRRWKRLGQPLQGKCQ